MRLYQCTKFLPLLVVMFIVFNCYQVYGSSDVAKLEITKLRVTTDGFSPSDKYEIYANFSRVGTKVYAEGNMMQVHPMSFCGSGIDDTNYSYGWVGFIKLEDPQFRRVCLSTLETANHSINSGATAIIFDVTENKAAWRQLIRRNLNRPVLDRPILVIEGLEAERLSRLVLNSNAYHVRIFSLIQIERETSKHPQTKDLWDVGIFTGIILLIVIAISIILIVSVRRRRRTKETSKCELTKATISKLEVRRCKNNPRISSNQSVISTASDGENCAICLEEYRTGQDLRVLPCKHEFHKICVDPWLMSNRTCPLCLYNIVEGKRESDLQPCTNIQASQTDEIPAYNRPNFYTSLPVSSTISYSLPPTSQNTFVSTPNRHVISTIPSSLQYSALNYVHLRCRGGGENDYQIGSTYNPEWPTNQWCSGSTMCPYHTTVWYGVAGRQQTPASRLPNQCAWRGVTAVNKRITGINTQLQHQVAAASSSSEDVEGFYEKVVPVQHHPEQTVQRMEEDPVSDTSHVGTCGSSTDTFHADVNASLERQTTQTIIRPTSLHKTDNWSDSNLPAVHLQPAIVKLMQTQSDIKYQHQRLSCSSVSGESSGDASRTAQAGSSFSLKSAPSEIISRHRKYYRTPSHTVSSTSSCDGDEDVNSSKSYSPDTINLNDLSECSNQQWHRRTYHHSHKWHQPPPLGLLERTVSCTQMSSATPPLRQGRRSHRLNENPARPLVVHSDGFGNGVTVSVDDHMNKLQLV